jgi:hypothetical protein
VSDWAGPRFDSGHDFAWYPVGTFHHGQNVNAAQTTIATLGLTTMGLWIRVDYASVNIDFSVLDVMAMGQLVMDFGDEVYVPFLSIAAEITLYETEIPIYPFSKTAQLALPFIIAPGAHIALRGQSGGLGDSTIAGTVSLSASAGL